MNSLREATGYARFADGKWQQIYTTFTEEAKTIEIGGSNPMPAYLYAALVIDLGLYMIELDNPLWSANFMRQSLLPTVGKH